MFSYGSSSSISLATVTPSLVMVGEPHFLSSTTLRPLGPRVTLTALATALAPRSSARRASSSNFNCLAAIGFSFEVLNCERTIRRSVADYSIDLIFIQQDQVLSIDGDLCAAIFGVDNKIAHLHGKRLDRSIVRNAAGSDCNNLAFLGLLLGRIREKDA